jgi:hypothetical protein
MNWILRLSNAYMRELDRRILWPQIMKEAERRGQDVHAARQAFLLHAIHDPIWSCLGRDEMLKQVERLH